MSRANVEFVEGLWAGTAGSDKQALLAALPELIAQTCDPEIEWVEDPQRPDSRIYRGHRGVRESWEGWLEGFDEYSFEIEDVVDCGDDVLVVSRERAQGASSGDGELAPLRGDNDPRWQDPPLPRVLRRASRTGNRWTVVMLCACG
jgi:hypothetical protein